jgi:hypothetical protein
MLTCKAQYLFVFLVVLSGFGSLALSEAGQSNFSLCVGAIHLSFEMVFNAGLAQWPLA